MTTSAADLGRLILELREKTGAGMTDCKKALTEAGGDLNAAVTALRKKGLADAAKKSGRATKEGQIEFARESGAGALVELNCETDFVARDENFAKLAADLARRAASGGLKTPEDAKPFIQPVFEKVKENMALRRLERYQPQAPALVSGYIHKPDGKSGKIGAMVELAAPSAAAADSPELAALAKELLHQIVGSPSTKYLNRALVPAADIEKEKEIYAEQLKREGKPEQAWPKIIEGKLNKLFYQQQCLLDQLWLKEPKTSVLALMEQAGAKLGGKVSLRRFVRYQLGE